MDQPQNLQQVPLEKYSLMLGGIAMLLLLFLSLLFAVERTTFMDNPFQIFLMIQDQNIEVMAGRYPSVIVRWLPYWTMKLGGSIQAMMLSFSSAYMLLHSLIYYIISFRLQKPAIGLAIPAMLTIATTDGFYWCNSELIQAISAAILCIVIWKSDLVHSWKYSSVVLLTLLTLFFHPLGIGILCYLFAYEVNWRKINYILLGIILFAVIGFFAKSALLPNWYDTMKFEEFNRNWMSFKNNLTGIPSLKSLFMTWHSASWSIIMLITSTVLLAFQKRWYAIVLSLTAWISFMLFIHLGDSLGPYSFYLEVNRTPLLVIALWPLIDFIYQDKYRYLILAIGILILIGIIRISCRASHYADRNAYYIENLNHKIDDKYYIFSDDAPMDLIEMDWASPYESLVLTSKNGKSKTLLITPKKEIITPTSPSEFIGSFKKYDPLNKNYFNLSDGDYKQLDIQK